MADSLAFELTLPASRFAALAAALNARLEPDSLVSAGVFEALLADPAARDVGLTFRFAPDPALEEFRREHPWLLSAVSGEVALGYLFVSVRAAADGANVSFFSTSRAVATVMRESEAVRGFFRSLAPLAEPAGVRVVDEWNDAAPL